MRSPGVAAPAVGSGRVLRWAAFCWLTRPAMLAVGCAAVLTFGTVPNPANRPNPRFSDNALVNLPARWDAMYYIEIASHGYHWDGNSRHQQLVAFLPGFPVVMRAVERASRIPMPWAGVAVSAVSFFFALIYLYCLIGEAVDESTARWTVLLIATDPFAVFFSAPYTEALFLLACAGALFHFRRGDGWRAAAWAFVAGATRVQGCALLAPLAWMAWRATRRSPIAPSQWVAVAAPALGLLLFSAHLYQVTGRPLLWLESQAAWGQPKYDELLFGKLPPAPPEEGRDEEEAPQRVQRVMQVADKGTAWIAIGAVPIVGFCLGAEYALLVIGSLALPLLGHTYMSMGRFVSVMFPVFGAFAWVLRGDRRVYALSAVFLVLQAILAAWFFTWHSVI